MPTSTHKKTVLKNQVWKKTGGICAHCGKSVAGRKRTIDHFVPRSRGGSYDNRNLVPLCENCNRERSDNIVIPDKFYLHAPKWVIEDCKQYLADWESIHKNAFGEFYI